MAAIGEAMSNSGDELAKVYELVEALNQVIAKQQENIGLLEKNVALLKELRDSEACRKIRREELEANEFDREFLKSIGISDSCGPTATSSETSCPPQS